jgi:hypothetical protein
MGIIGGVFEPLRFVPRQEIASKTKWARFDNIGHNPHVYWLKTAFWCGNAAVTAVTKLALSN